MQIKFTVQTVCVAISTGALAFAGAYNAAAQPVSGAGWVGIGVATVIAIVAALTHDPNPARRVLNLW